jgi:hypothetical protein
VCSTRVLCSLCAAHVCCVFFFKIDPRLRESEGEKFGDLFDQMIEDGILDEKVSVRHGRPQCRVIHDFGQ